MSGVHEEVFWISAVVLSLERLAYAAIWRNPAGFRWVCNRWLPETPPVDVLARLFVLFKLLQCFMFLSWWIAHGDGLRPAASATGPRIVGALLVVAGQLLNAAVFVRLGRVGVFYGGRLGEVVPWRAGFPFSWFRHPQYVGTVVSIWGAFVLMRYPAVDWSVIPALETLYYAAGAYFEEQGEASEAD